MLYQMFFQIKEWFKFLGVQEEEGQGLVEYALIIVLVSVVVIGVLLALGGQIENVFQAIIDAFTEQIGNNA